LTLVARVVLGHPLVPVLVMAGQSSHELLRVAVCYLSQELLAQRHAASSHDGRDDG